MSTLSMLAEAAAHMQVRVKEVSSNSENLNDQGAKNTTTNTPDDRSMNTLEDSMYIINTRNCDNNNKKGMKTIETSTTTKIAGPEHQQATVGRQHESLDCNPHAASKSSPVVVAALNKRHSNSCNNTTSDEETTSNTTTQDGHSDMDEHEMATVEESPSSANNTNDFVAGDELKLLKLKESRNQAWMEKFEKLKEFKEAHGHCFVTQKHDSRLSGFVKYQRYLWRSNSRALLRERKKLLDSIGFVWDQGAAVKGDSVSVSPGELPAPPPPPPPPPPSAGSSPPANGEKWLIMYSRLKDYWDKWGVYHVRTHKGAYEERSIGKWLKSQMLEYKRWEEGKKSSLTDKRALMLRKIGIEEMFSTDNRDDEVSSKTRSDADKNNNAREFEIEHRKNLSKHLEKKSNAEPHAFSRRENANTERGSMNRKRVVTDSYSHNGNLPLKKRTRIGKSPRACSSDKYDHVRNKQTRNKKLTVDDKADGSCRQDRDALISKHVAKYFETDDHGVEELYFGTIVSAGIIKGKYKYTVLYDDNEEEHISGKRIGKMIRLYNENKQSDVRFLRQDFEKNKMKTVRRNVKYWKVVAAELRMELDEIETEYRSEMRSLKKQIKELKGLVTQQSKQI